MLAPCWTTDVNAGQQGGDVLLLMLCIQCKKMYTVWVRSPGDGGMFKTAEAAFVRLRGLLLCADNDDERPFV
jgi:hypothetical protein